MLKLTALSVPENISKQERFFAINPSSHLDYSIMKSETNCFKTHLQVSSKLPQQRAIKVPIAVDERGMEIMTLDFKTEGIFKAIT